VIKSTSIVGTCTAHAEKGPIDVDFPAIGLQEPPPVTAYRIDGTTLAYDSVSPPGHATVAGTTYELYPFAKVDCAKCGGDGWQELHTLLWSAAEPKLGIALLYLFPPAAARDIQMSYGVMLPSGERLSDAITFPGATWSTTP
jgi:hypothetical protein